MDDHDSYQPLPPPPHTTTTTTLETVESAIESLMGSWQRRRSWQLLLGCCPVESRPAGDVGERPTWRTRLASFLESTPVHLATLGLLLLDFVLTVVDLSSSLVSCSRGDNESGASPSTAAERFYRWAGIAILAVLAAKIAALALALGVSFLKSPGHVVDAAVIVGALLLELLKEGAGGEAGGLLLVVSLWRLVRVVEGTFELSNEAIEEQIKGITSQFEGLKEEIRRAEEGLREKEKRIAELQEELARRSQQMR